MQLIDREITIKIAPREDGGLRVWSDDLPGLILSHKNRNEVCASRPALLQRMQGPVHRHGWHRL